MRAKLAIILLCLVIAVGGVAAQPDSTATPGTPKQDAETPGAGTSGPTTPGPTTPGPTTPGPTTPGPGTSGSTAPGTATPDPGAPTAATPNPPAPPPGAPPPGAPPPGAPGPGTPSVTVLDTLEVQGILGRDVRSTADENMGRIVDVLVDGTGRARAAIIDFGGFLGVGSRKIAVEWKALHFVPAAEKRYSVVLELTREQVKPAPEYKEGKPVIVLGASGNLEPLP